MQLKHTLLAVVFALMISGCEENKVKQADIIVYGGTSAAVTTAVQAARMGRSVIIVSPEKHLGGLSSSGLGFTDTGNKDIIGGIAREFYHRVYLHYQDPSAWKWQKKEDYGNVGQETPAMDTANSTMWIFEPHVAEGIFEAFIRENHITVVRNEWLDREHGVHMDGGRITSITTLSGHSYKGKMFVDATYEGDLMAAAGVTYFVGREAGSVYGEKWNGVQTGVFHHHHYFGDMHISPYVVPGDPSSGVLPRISTASPGKKGDGDKHVQAYCFRLCLTKNDDNRIPFTRPAGYDSTQYELLVRIFNAGWRGTFNKFDPIPNLKTDVNNHGPFSTDNIGMNDDYPDASYERRREMVNEHENYEKGLFYFIATDPRVPPEIRTKMQKWGYARDEFADNGNWPYKIYIREARRMIGEYVMTEKDILGEREVPEPVGMGSYTMDSHNVQRYITPEGFVENEGDLGVPVTNYRIALGAILPRKGECRNLVVPVAVSASHIAFGSIRMEPVFMILGQAAGTVASLAVDNGTDTQDLPYEKVRMKLTGDGQILSEKQAAGMSR